MRPLTLPSGYGLALLGSFLFGVAITYSRGAYSEPALLMVLLGVLVLVWAFLQEAKRDAGQGGRAIAWLVFAGAFGLVWTAWNDPETIIYAQRAWEKARTAQAAQVLLILSYVPFLVLPKLREPNLVRWARFGLLGFSVAVACHDAIVCSPRPYIDVWTVQQAGAEAMSNGDNPYTAVAMRDTGPREAQDVPYVYPPTQVYLTLPAYLLAKDVRYSMVFGLLLAGLLMRLIAIRGAKDAPAIVHDGPALFLWLTPKMLFIIEQSWVDPLQVGVISLAAWSYFLKRKWISAVLFGLMLSAKQTMFWGVGLAMICLGYSFRQMAITAGVGLALWLPFLVWDFGAWKHANFDFVNGLPHRADALTFNNWGFRKFGKLLPGAFGFFAGAVVAALSLWKMRGTAARYGLALAATYTAFFIFNKWAFANYYFLLGSLCALAAALALPEPQEPAAAPVAVPAPTVVDTPPAVAT